MAKPQTKIREETSTIRTDFQFKNKVIEMHKSDRILQCLQCGACTSNCIIARFSDLYKPRRIARIIQLGLKDRILGNEDLWLCTTCSSCADNCPQGVEVSSLIRTLRNLSIEEGKQTPHVYRTFALSILRTGFAYNIPRSRLNSRKIRNIPPLPTSIIPNITRLSELSGFSAKIEKTAPHDQERITDGNSDAGS